MSHETCAKYPVVIHWHKWFQATCMNMDWNLNRYLVMEGENKKTQKRAC
jgi:hypothetical protein